MKTPKVVWVIGDGKPGHENQSLGLADALVRQTGCEVHRLRIDPGAFFFKRLREAKQAARVLPKPDWLIAAGHRTHGVLWGLARRYRARSIVLMKPSLPLACFDLCIAPSHDFATASPPERVILSRGALNRVVADPLVERTESLLLVGGPSRTHGWDGEALLKAVGAICRSGRWVLTDSRRTPEGFLEDLRRVAPELEIFPHQETPAGWLPARLGRAREVWVTEDSVSMIYEALSSGAKVGLLPSPRRKASSRVLAGIAELVAEAYLTPYDRWQVSGELSAPPRLLAEAERCAAEVLARLGGKAGR